LHLYLKMTSFDTDKQSEQVISSDIMKNILSDYIEYDQLKK
jgi:hypothetical protein